MTELTLSPLVGYFDQPAQERPALDPGLEVECPICEFPLEIAPRTTISVLVPGDNRCFFFRAHKTCYTMLSDDDQSVLDGTLVVDLRIAARDSN